MRILVLHHNVFERLRYDTAIDHAEHEVVYAGTAEYIHNIPSHVYGTRLVVDPEIDVAEQLERWMRTQPPFDRIITRYEGYILPAAELRSKFRIEGMMPEEAARFRDKVVMKQTLSAKGIRVPRFVSLSEGPQRVSWSGKTVLKPRDEGASQGVVVFPTPDAAFAHVRERQAMAGGEKFMEKHELEEFLEGDIWHIDGYLFQGRPVVIKASRYIGSGLAFEHGEPLGSVQYDNPDLEAWTVDCLAALGVGTLTFHLEAILTTNGPVFMEVAARGGGGYVTDVIEAALGVHLHEIDIATQVEGELAVRFLKKDVRGTTYGFFLFPGHQYKGARCYISVDENLINDPCVVSYKIVSPGCHAPNYGTSYREEHLPFCGIVNGKSSDDVFDWINNLFAHVTISAETNSIAG